MLLHFLKLAPSLVVKSKVLSASPRAARSPRVQSRTSEDTAKIQSHKSNRGSTQVAPDTVLLEYTQPKKRSLVSETERWEKLAAKAAAFRSALEEYMEANAVEVSFLSI